MASSSVSNSTKEGSPKRLAELLDQQQEPFILEVYLHERGYKKKSLRFEGISFGCLFGGKKLSERSTRNVGLHCRRRERSRICNRIAKDLSNKLVCINEILRIKDKEATTTTMDESGRLSSGSLSTEFNSCSESDADDTIINNGSQIQIQRQFNHQTDEDAAADEMVQCSPVSVLDQIEMIPNATSRLSFSFPNLKRATEECIFSASLWELFVRKKRCIRRHMNSKKARHLVGPEKLGKIICDKIRCWDKQSVNEKRKIIKLLRSDLLSSYQKQDSFDNFTEDVVKEVGDKILEEMTDEFVHLYLCRSHRVS